MLDLVLMHEECKTKELLKSAITLCKISWKCLPKATGQSTFSQSKTLQAALISSISCFGLAVT